MVPKDLRGLASNFHSEECVRLGCNSIGAKVDWSDIAVGSTFKEDYESDLRNESKRPDDDRLHLQSVARQ